MLLISLSSISTSFSGPMFVRKETSSTCMIYLTCVMRSCDIPLPWACCSTIVSSNSANESMTNPESEYIASLRRSTTLTWYLESNPYSSRSKRWIQKLEIVLSCQQKDKMFRIELYSDARTCTLLQTCLICGKLRSVKRHHWFIACKHNAATRLFRS